MSHIPFFRQAMARVKPFAPPHLLAEDEWRLMNGWFGPLLRPLRPQAVAVFVGARSGLEIMLARLADPGLCIIVIESSEDQRSMITQLGIESLQLHGTIEAAIEGLPQHLHFVRFAL